MKLKIKDLEQKLSKKIKTNYSVIGLDTAKRTGVCKIITDSTYAYFDWNFYEFNYSNQKEMLIQMYKAWDGLFKKENLIVVEEVFIGFSRTGSLRLAKMGTLAVGNCIKKKINFELILAKTARAKLKINTKKYGKGKSKLAVADWLKTTLGINLGDSDASDATILALLGIIEDMTFTPVVKKRKKNGKKL